MNNPEPADPGSAFQSDVSHLFAGLSAVAFDFDGVLVDSVEVKTDAFADLYRTESEEFRAAVVAHHEAHGGVSRHEKIRHYERLRTGLPADFTRVDQLADEFASSVKNRVIAAREIRGAGELLARLSGLLPLFVCSGTPEVELREIVAARGLSEHFDGVYGSPSDKASMLRAIADSLGCETGQILLFGDSTTDSDAASKSGARFFLVSAADDGEKPIEHRGNLWAAIHEVVATLHSVDLAAVIASGDSNND